MGIADNIPIKGLLWLLIYVALYVERKTHHQAIGA